MGKDGQAVTSLSREGKHQLDQEGRGRGPRNRTLEGKVSKEDIILLPLQVLTVTQEHLGALKV